MTAPLTQLKTAERDLVNTINGVAVVVEGIATDSVDDALLRLEHAVRAAHGRLAAAFGTMANTIGELTDTMKEMTAGAMADLRSAAVEITGPGLLEFPAPAATPTPSPTAQEPTETTVESTPHDEARGESPSTSDREPVTVGAPSRNGKHSSTRTRSRRG